MTKWFWSFPSKRSVEAEAARPACGEVQPEEAIEDGDLAAVEMRKETVRSRSRRCGNRAENGSGMAHEVGHSHLTAQHERDISCTEPDHQQGAAYRFDPPCSGECKKRRDETPEHGDVELLQTVRHEHERRYDSQNGEQEIRIRTEEFSHNAYRLAVRPTATVIWRENTIPSTTNSDVRFNPVLEFSSHRPSLAIRPSERWLASEPRTTSHEPRENNPTRPTR